MLFNRRHYAVLARYATPAYIIRCVRTLSIVAVAMCAAVVYSGILGAQVVLQQPSAAGFVFGIVRSASGAGVQGVTVSVTGPQLSSAITVVTDVNGLFTARVPGTGTYAISIKRIGLTSQTSSVDIRPGTSQIVEIDLGGASRVRVAEAPNAPLLQPFADAKNWVLHTNLVYRVGNTRDSVVVPAGFVTDFASIPSGLQSFFSVHGPWLVAGIVHDYLYWNQGLDGCTRAEADGIFRLVMLENKATRFEAEAMYTAVDLVGERAWNANRADRRAGLVRVLPSSRRTLRRLVLWPDFRRALLAEGLQPDPARPVSRAFCSHGSRNPRDVLDVPGGEPESQ